MKRKELELVMTHSIKKCLTKFPIVANTAKEIEYNASPLVNHDISKEVSQQRYYRLSRIELKLICEGCRKYVEQTARDIGGVKSARCSPEGLLEVRFNPAKTSTNKIEQAISESGHETKNYKAKIEFYTEKPKCCQYRDENKIEPSFRA